MILCPLVSIWTKPEKVSEENVTSIPSQSTLTWCLASLHSSHMYSSSPCCLLSTFQRKIKQKQKNSNVKSGAGKGAVW